MATVAQQSPHIPAALFAGNRVFGAADPTIKALGINELGKQDFTITDLNNEDENVSANVMWVEEDTPGRKRKRKTRLALEVTNPGLLPLGISLSLSASTQPQLVTHDSSESRALESGLLCRSCPAKHETPNIPAAMGREVSFVTIAASIPPQSAARICSCCHNADAVPGFVYLMGPEKPHPNPNQWHDITLRMPLAGPPGMGWLCTQGFGGSGHHRGASMHHSVDFDCDPGTSVVAVASGIIIEVIDSKSLGGGHVDLLPEANIVRLQLDHTGHVAVYLHLRQGSCTVSVGDHVSRGDHLGESGNVGFTTGPHLHFQLNTDEKEESETLMYGFIDCDHGVTVPVAGYRYGDKGMMIASSSSPLPGGSVSDAPQALHLLRKALACPPPLAPAPPPIAPIAPVAPIGPIERASLSPVDTTLGSPHRGLVEQGLLWLKTDQAKDSIAPSTEGGEAEEESDEEALKPYPSDHTCLVSNVVALESLLREGIDSRFLQRGSIPPVYLSCAANFDRDTDTGECFSYEICIGAHQERCREEALGEEIVSFCLCPRWGSDWLGYFKSKFRLQQAYEVYRGDDFVRNQAKARPILAGELAYGPVFSLHRTTIEGFEEAARLGCEEHGDSLCRGGCVVAFRHEASDKEPFGIWWGWLLLGEDLFIIDLQNSALTHTLQGAIQSLDWDQPAREEAFFAAFK